MISIIISALLLIACVIGVIFGSSQFYIGFSSIFSVLFIIRILYDGICIWLDKKIFGWNIVGEYYMQEEEKAKMYKIIYNMILPAVICEFFLVFYFSEYLKLFLSFLIIVLFHTAITATRLIISKKSADRKSEIEAQQLKEQIKKEAV